MNLVNVFFALDSIFWAKLEANFTRNSEGQRNRVTELSNAQVIAYSNFYTGMWNKPSATEVLVSWYLPDDLNLPETGIKAIGELLATSPGKIKVLGVWNANGTQFGWYTQLPEYNESGTIVPVPGMTWDEGGRFWYSISKAMYTQTPLLTIFPDDITYASDGTELTRTVAIAPKEVHKLAGRKNRIWI